MPLIVEAFMASLKVAETTVLILMLVELLEGETDKIVGRVTSAVPVVNDQVKLFTSAFPARSFTPEAPPVIVAVYIVELANAADGIKVAV